MLAAVACFLLLSLKQEGRIKIFISLLYLLACLLATATEEVKSLLLFFACCCCHFNAILMTHLSYMTLLEIYPIDCTRMTSRPSRKESKVTPLYNGHYIILKLQQKHHAKSYVIG